MIRSFDGIQLYFKRDEVIAAAIALSDKKIEAVRSEVILR